MPIRSKISLPSFFFRISYKPGNEMINFGPIASGVHITVHFGSKSKTLDVHKTYEGVNKKYKTVLEIRHFTLLRFYVFFYNELLPDYMKMFDSRIKLGMLKKYHCLVQEFSESALSPYFTTDTKQIKIKTKKHISFEDFENIYKSPDDIQNNVRTYGVYRLYKNGLRWNGILLNYPISDKTNRSFIFLSKKKQKIVLKQLLPRIILFIKTHDLILYNKIITLKPEYQIISKPDNAINKEIKQFP